MKRIAYILTSFTIGALASLLVFAIAVRVFEAFQSEPAQVVLGRALTEAGSLEWIDSPIVGGFIATGAAFVGFSAIQRQIRAADLAVSRQLKHVDELEAARRLAKYEASLAVLPLSLSLLIDSSRERAAAIRTCIELCATRNLLPHGQKLPNFAPIPSSVIGDLKEIIELSDLAHRAPYRRLLVAMQVQTARLTALANYDREPIWSVLKSNLVAYMVGEAEIYALSAKIYSASILVHSGPLPSISKRDIASGLFAIGIYDGLWNEIVEGYGLESDDAYPISG